MSFDRNHPNRKDHRKPFRGSKRWDRSCRNHGGCPYCGNGRQHANKRREPIPEPETKDK